MLKKRVFVFGFSVLSVVFLLFSCSSGVESKLHKAGYEADGQGFIEAVKNGDAESVSLFVKLPGLLNFSDKFGATPLMYAAQSENSAIFLKLIENGANLTVMDNSERMPLHYAVRGNSVKNVKILLERGADFNFQDNFGRDAANTFLTFVKDVNVELFKIVIENSSNLERRDKENKTLFIIAAEKGIRSYIEILIDRGVSPLPKDFKGKTALDYATEAFEAKAIDEETFALIADYTRKIKEKL